jgi:membrane protein
MLKWLETLEDGLFVKSRPMGPPWGALLRFVRYPAALIRDWMRGEISVRAMSLAYTTLLSLVPLLVFSFSILKGLGARGDLRFLLNEFFRPVGGATEQLTESVMQFVTNMRGGLLGSIGLAFLVYTVIATIEKVEGSFNYLWQVERARSFARRFTEYLSVMILGPILLAVALGLLTTAENSLFAQWLGASPWLGWTMTAAAGVLPYLIVTIVFTFMYCFIPNTKVQFRAALIGGVSAGILWALVGQLFTAFIVYSSQMVAIYTGFAIVLTTLIWVYMSWVILLMGAQLAFYLQFPQYLRYGHAAIELSAKDREQVGLSIMYLVGRDFQKAQTGYWSAASLAAELDVPGGAIAPVLRRLENAGLLVATEKEGFVPGHSPHSVRLCDILQALLTLHNGRLKLAIRSIGPAIAVMRDIDDAMMQRLGERTLQDMLGDERTTSEAGLETLSSPAAVIHPL